MLIFSFPLFAETQQIIITSHLRSGSYDFASEFVRLWKLSQKSGKANFSTKPVSSPTERLNQLENNQGNLAFIDPQTAIKVLDQYDGLRVLSVLWPNRLQIFGRIQGTKLTLDSSRNMLMHENTLFFAQVWKQLVPQSNLYWFNEDNFPDVGNIFTQENSLTPNVLAISGPLSFVQMNDWMQQIPNFHILSLEPQIIRALQAKYSWLSSKQIPKNTYFNQLETVESVVWYPVLVVRRDFPDSIAKAVLELMFDEKQKLSPHVLFQELRANNNLPFQKVYRYHSAAKNMYRFK